MKPGHATAEGTSRYVSRFPALAANGFFRAAGELHVSTLGLGTYLGQPDDAVDQAYREAAQAAARGGINLFDTAINYRHQRSERALGQALGALLASGELRRDEVVIATKAGFLTPGAVPDTLDPQDVAGRMHSMAPDFLADQVERSRANLALQTIDIFYLHNPETQLNFVSREEFERRIAAAFARLERLVEAGRIRCYGTATWDGFRQPGKLSLGRLLEIAAAEAGPGHHFRCIQLPFNLGMAEALTGCDSDGRSVLETAARAGMIVVASASLLQSRLTRDLPPALAEKLPGLDTDAQRAIQFTRSTPGVTVALAGMSRAAHVAENLGVGKAPPASDEQYARLYRE